MGIFENGIDKLLLGGILIGVAVGLLTVLTGRAMNASGMIGSLLGGAEGVAATSIAFIGGILVAPLIITKLGFPVQLAAEADWPFLVAGGLFVGIAARFGGASLGGTLTGMARRSGQAAVLFGAIMVGAAIAVYLQRAFSGGGVT